MWLGPPAIHSKMTLLRRLCRAAGAGRFAASPQQLGQTQSGNARQAGLEHAAAADHGQPFAFDAVEVIEGVLLMHCLPAMDA